MISLAYADSPATQAAAPSPFVSMAPLLIIFVIFYFLLIRPQQKKMKDHKKMLEELKNGDMVITSSGIYGVIVGIGESTFDVRLADNVKVKMQKSAVTERVSTTKPQEIEKKA